MTIMVEATDKEECQCRMNESFNKSADECLTPRFGPNWNSNLEGIKSWMKDGYWGCILQEWYTRKEKQLLTHMSSNIEGNRKRRLD